MNVREFTEGAMGTKCPERPVVMSRDRVQFIIRMVMSELDELTCTVCDNQEEVDAFMTESLTTRDRCTEFNYEKDIDKTEAQGDAMVDAMYYMYDSAARHGINLSKIFNEVHTANMNKRDPETGVFKRREDGKVMKPEGWKAPDIGSVMKDQYISGSWS